MASNPNAPIVIGNLAGRLTPNAGAELNTSLYGLDTLTRPFTCLTGELWKYTPKKYAPDTEYPKMYYIETRVRYVEGLLTTADLVYSGKANGLPEPEINDSYSTKITEKPITWTSWVLNPVEGGGTESQAEDNTITIFVQYRAPGTSYSWIADRKPADAPPVAYRKVRSSVSPFRASQIVRIAVKYDNGATVIIPQATVDKFFASEKFLESVEQFEVKELIPGRYWQCTSVVSRLIDPDLTAIAISEPEP